jgi:hypothetical protein
MSSTRKTLEHIIPTYSLLQDAVAAAEAAAAEAAAAEAAAAEAAEAAEAAAAAVCRGDAAASASLEHGSYFPFRDRWSGRDPPYLLVGLEGAIRLTSGIPWPRPLSTLRSGLGTSTSRRSRDPSGSQAADPR